MSDLSIRVAGADDLDAIVDGNRRLALETEGLELDLERLSRGVAAVLCDPRRGHYWVALQSGEVIGQLMTIPEWSDWRNGEFWWIHSVYVHQDHRRKGVYRGMYEFILEAARQQGGVCGARLYVEKDNQSAQATYRSLGMDVTHYDMFEVDFVLDRDA